MEKDIIISRSLAFTLLKWKVKPGQSINKGAILATYEQSGTGKTLKLKCEDVGTVVRRNVEEGKTIEPGVSVVTIQGCQHTTVMKQMCADCGADLKDFKQDESKTAPLGSASVAMVHSIPELIISKERAMELGKADEQRLLDQRKLVLLVDLDQTLIHTTNDTIPANLKDVYHFQLPHGRSGMMWYHTKFRPHTLEFLDRIAKMYELHICTFGVRLYAHTIANLMDPNGKLFSHRILSRDECFSANSKTANLKALFPCGDSMVCIIDDREDVWSCVSNLVHVKPYMFFNATADINAPPGLSKAGDGAEEGVTQKRKETIHMVPKGQPMQLNCVPSNGEESKEKSEEDKEKKVAQKTKEDNVCEESSEVVVNESTEESSDKRIDVDTGTEKDGMDTCVETNDGALQPVNSADVEKNDNDQLPISMEDAESNDTKEREATEIDREVKPDDVTGKLEIIETDNSCDQQETSSDPNTDVKNGSTISDSLTTQPEKTCGDLQTDLSQMCTEEIGHEASDKTSIEPGGAEVGSGVMSEGEDKNATEDEDKKLTENDSQKPEEKPKTEIEYERIIEWEDDDDYLHYLEDILTKVHKAFYEVHDQMKKQDVPKEVPDLKSVIPYVRRKVLKGANIVFSGVFPTNQPPQKSRAYRVAKSLGANIQLTFVEAGLENATTHVIGAKPGTAKVNMAQKSKSVHVVTPQWLWSCNNRWEWVDERVFPLSEKTQARNASDSPDISKIKKKKVPTATLR